MTSSGKLSDYKNAFINLALPFMILTEPAEPAKEPLVGDRTWTLWDKWAVTGSKETTLADFIASVKDKRVNPNRTCHRTVTTLSPRTCARQ